MNKNHYALILATTLMLFLFGCANTAQILIPTTTTPGPQPVIEEETQLGNPNYLGGISSSEFIVRQQYFEEAFKPRRNEYNFFEQTSKYLNVPIEKVPALFTLKSEEEIFEELPPVPEDFSETAYALVSGRYYSIGFLEEEYFLQPEFYPNFKTIAPKKWTQPDPKSWTPQGYGIYPAQQFDSLKKGEREEFIGVIFFHSSWGVQGWQGVTLVPTSESLKYFDIEITPNTFLIGPTFPKFTKSWSQKIAIKGKLKPETQPGNYKIGFEVVSPPSEFIAEWERDHKLLYFNATGSIRPSGYPAQFEISVR